MYNIIWSIIYCLYRDFNVEDINGAETCGAISNGIQ